MLKAVVFDHLRQILGLQKGPYGSEGSKSLEKQTLQLSPGEGGALNIGSDCEVSTIEKQRKELQLLIGELKDRDRELNDMVAVHQRQLLAWEEDRQKVLTLEERCSKLEGELHKRSEIIRSLIKKVKALESNQNESQMNLQKTQQQLQEMAQKATHAALLSEDLEARNQNLSSTLVDLSAQVGQLQAREQALTTMIKLKDKDIIEAVNHIADCSGKFKLLEQALRDAKVAETSIAKEKQDYKQKLKTLKVEIGKLKEELNEKTTENNDQREEIIRLKQEKSYLQDELVFTVEREKRKDDLLDIAKSKQERTSTELHNLRQIYVKQQRDLQFLHFNVENSHELVQLCDSKVEEAKALESSGDMCLADLENSHSKAEAKRSREQQLLVKDQQFETLVVQQTRSDRSPSDVCKEKKVLAGASLGVRSVTAFACLCAKDSMQRHKSWPPRGRFHTEPESRGPLCKIHARSPQETEPGRPGPENPPPGACPAGEKPWRDVSVYLGLTGCPGCTSCRDSLAADAAEARAEPCCCRDPGAGLAESDAWDSQCCHPSNFIVEAPGHVSDVQWMSIFKPRQTERIVRRKSTCSCADNVSGAKYDPLESDPGVTAHHSSCLVSSSSTLREDEKFLETDSASFKKNPSQVLFPRPRPPMNAACVLFQDDSSPTSRLQRLLAESRQMVSDLELSTLLPLGSEHLNSGDQNPGASGTRSYCPTLPVGNTSLTVHAVTSPVLGALPASVACTGLSPGTGEGALTHVPALHTAGSALTSPAEPSHHSGSPCPSPELASLSLERSPPGPGPPENAPSAQESPVRGTVVFTVIGD
ncbi:PREDICTED: coiled-coil domain-containing protein 62 [Elephantulus edwardii]|uniref:coiled-coil domain-containing protein 62 n=1 Tax=Elephantulus edwardii TaxID=28737 RepID=UPI0003F082BF|nr:PREDICTED: coiled-coil domain-containing protein 62 [Elephantulus edwardii]